MLWKQLQVNLNPFFAVYELKTSINIRYCTSCLLSNAWHSFLSRAQYSSPHLNSSLILDFVIRQQIKSMLWHLPRKWDRYRRIFNLSVYIPLRSRRRTRVLNVKGRISPDGNCTSFSFMVSNCTKIERNS